jgi:hypothetical protein
METNFQFENSKLTVDGLYALHPFQFIEAARDTFSKVLSEANPALRFQESKMTYLSVKSYVSQADHRETDQFNALAEALENAVDDDDLDEDDVYDYMDTIGEYLEALERVDDVDTYDMGMNLSANLLALFSKTKAAVDVQNDDQPASQEVWVAPSSYGLDNSRPIIKFNKDTNFNGNFFGNYEVVSFDEINDDNEGGSDEDDEDWDEDDDDDYDEEGDDDEEYLPSGAMSASLMAALGLSVEHVNTETDWKPPTTFGLTADGQLRSEQRGTQRSDDEDDDDEVEEDD